MNDTTGDFNYTGLVENMELKAGMFYGMDIEKETLLEVFSF